MTLVTTICSLILALMMALSGGASVTGTPEMMDVLTLRNVALDIDFFGEEMNIVIPMEFQLASAAGVHEGVLHFEIHGEDGEVLLPLSGKVVSDALQFTIGDSPRAYGVYEQTIRDEMMLTEADMEMLDSMLSYISYAVENGMVNSELDMIRSSARMMRVLADQKGVASEETTVSYGDGEYAALKRSYSATQDEVQALLENPPAGLSEEDGKALEEYAVFDGYLKMLNEYSQLMLEEYEDQISVSFGYSDNIDVEITEAEVDGEAYLSAKQTYTVGDSDFEIEYVVYGNRARMGQRNVSEYEVAGLYTRNTSTIEYVYDGPLSAPESISTVGLITNYTEYDDAYAVESNVYLYMNGGMTDGLWNLEGDMSVVSSTRDPEADSASADGAEIKIPFSYSETLEDDGSKTGHVTMSMNYVNMMDLNLSFDVNMAKAPYVDFFEGKEVVWTEEMTEELALMLEDEWTQALEAAGTAFEDWAAEVEAELGLQTVEPEGGYMVYPDGSIEHISYSDVSEDDSTKNSIRESVRAQVIGDEADYADEDEYAEEMYAISVYYSWAEAQEAFDGELPDFTPPEQWPLRSIEMYSQNTLRAEYGDGYNGYILGVIDHGDVGTEIYTLQDGKLVPSDEILVDCYSEDGEVYWAKASFGNHAISIAIAFLGDVGSLTDVETILAGFDF